MRTNFIKSMKKLITIIVLITGLVTYSQDIHFTFGNAQNTNDGSNDYYEVDIMLQTINATGSFKLGSGQLYFNYSTAAFGTNVFGSGGFVVTQVNPDNIAGQFIDIAPGINIYGPFTINDNTTSKVSWAFSQVYSSSTFAVDNVSPTPAKLCHLKIKYIDVGQAPMVLFEEGGTFIDQFFTACGPAGGATELANCGTDPGAQILNDTFDSNGATLSNETFEILTGLSVYPNPTKGILYINGDTNKLKNLKIFTITGQHVMSVKNNFKEIDITKLSPALYFVKFITAESTGTIKIIRE